MTEPAPDNPSFPPTSMGLLQNVKRKDPDAWRRLATLYSPLIYQWCRKAGLSPNDSADVMQDVFLTIVTSIEGFRKELLHHRFRRWLRTITHSRIVDHHRRRARQAGNACSLNESVADLTPEASAGESRSDRLNDEVESLYRRAVQLMETEFEPRTWKAFWKFAIEGEDAEKVASDLAMTANTVRKYKSRVLRRMREEFGESAELERRRGLGGTP